MTKIQKANFGKTQDGRIVTAYTLVDGACSARILDYGGIIQNLIVPDKNGKGVDVVLGYDDVRGYEVNGGYLSALIGRFGNRIDKGRFTLDGKEYQLYCNDRGNHLHGGKVGFDKKIWDAEIVTDENGNEGLKLSILSPDGEENYPGNLTVTVLYTLIDGELKIDYDAVSDKKTLINLTNHAYFNVEGEGVRDILDTYKTFDAPYYVPTDDTLIPHGELAKVDGTPFDFRKAKQFKEGDKFTSTDPDLQKAGGFDHCFVFGKNHDPKTPYAVCHSDTTGITMKCYTDMPAVHLYAGCGLNAIGKGGKEYKRSYAFCLETEAIPNNVNVPEYAEYGSSVYDANERYKFFASYKFEV